MALLYTGRDLKFSSLQTEILDPHDPSHFIDRSFSEKRKYDRKAMISDKRNMFQNL